jgi:hypothetical protein
MKNRIAPNESRTGAANGDTELLHNKNLCDLLAEAGKKTEEAT